APRPAAVTGAGARSGAVGRPHDMHRPRQVHKDTRDAAPRASPRTVRRTTHTLFAPVSRLGGDVRGRAPGTGDAVAPSRRSTREIVVTTMSDAQLMQAELTELRRWRHRRQASGTDL